MKRHARTSRETRTLSHRVKLKHHTPFYLQVNTYQYNNTMFTRILEQFNASSLDAYLKRLDLLTTEEVREDFILACRYNHLVLVQELLRIDGDRRIDVHANNEYAFRWACEKGCLEMVRLLLALEGDRRIDVHAENEYAFRMVCRYGHLEIVKLLLALEGDRRIDVHTNNEYAFFWACENGHLEIVDLFLALDGDRKIPEELVPKKYLPATPATPKHTKYTCLVSYEPIEENEEYVECLKNPEHVVKHSIYTQTTFNTCLICKINNVKKYINKAE